MRYFRDEALLRRALGAALLLALLGMWARQWREDATSQGTYVTGSYNAANDLMYAFWTLAVVAALYVAACLLLTPRNGGGESDLG
jgi:hypothetical protein